ncbi:hypothetical protein B4U80_12824 [Leptotrombidium deliense]|uniref:ENPP1-3/EXOG-like endonuclease/phosphodiesterase domain-containing protein n=1 Tax=Leptotrombidium deliense TaxID=299467 RepID=A0A443SKD6_9ACAR|nr:hypothetical protein B4U80_12824 [Leptotrombidium deliense]
MHSRLHAFGLPQFYNTLFNTGVYVKYFSKTGFLIGYSVRTRSPVFSIEYVTASNFRIHYQRARRSYHSSRTLPKVLVAHKSHYKKFQKGHLATMSYHASCPKETCDTMNIVPMTHACNSAIERIEKIGRKLILDSNDGVCIATFPLYLKGDITADGIKGIKRVDMDLCEERFPARNVQRENAPTFPVPNFYAKIFILNNNIDGSRCYLVPNNNEISKTISYIEMNWADLNEILGIKCWKIVDYWRVHVSVASVEISINKFICLEPDGESG